MEPSKVQEAEKMKETDREPIKEEEPNAACVSALHMILESLMRTAMFPCDPAITHYPEQHQRLVQEYLDQLYLIFLKKLSLMEENGGGSEILINVLEILTSCWNRHLRFDDLVKMKCTRCKMDTEYPPEPSFGIYITANSLRETKSAFKDFTFERILKFIKINSMTPCKTEGCENLISFVDHIIPILPSVFTIALEWENNETEDEILATTSVLATEIDISKIYKYEGGSPQTKYSLVSMVCSHGDEYACVAYGNNKWVCYFPSTQQAIGDWDSVISTVVRLNMRPEILFYENDMQRKQMKAEEPSAACVSALDMILKSLMRTTMFSCDLDITLYPATHQSFIQEYLAHLYHLFLNKLSLMRENGGVSEILINVLEILTSWWNSHLKFDDLVKMKCTRCKMNTEYPPQPSFGIIIIANSLRETKSAFKEFTFERILKVIRINSMTPCKTEGCEKLSFVDHIIPTLPSVFTIALEWENNETEEDILATTSVLATEIDISKIYKYESDSPHTKYNLVSMVCSHGDQYACVAYENNGWVSYFPSEQQEVIGDWGSVINTFIRLNMRPEILFFENDMQRKRIVNAQINIPSDEKNRIVQTWHKLQIFLFSLQPQS